MLYTKSILLTICASLLLLVQSHTDFSKFGDLRVEDMWCFDPAYKVGIPNLYKKMEACINGDNQQCIDAHDNFCAANGIHNSQCQQLSDMINGQTQMQCGATLMTGIRNLANRLEECMGTAAYGLWESHLITHQGPHHTPSMPRRLLDNTNPDSLTYHVHDKHSLPRNVNVANYVHKAVDAGIAGDCNSARKYFVAAGNVALIGNMRVNGLPAGDDVDGETFAQLYSQFEGLATVNHGDIEMHYSTSKFWDMFNGLAMARLPNHITCNWRRDVDHQWRNSCHRSPYTKHY